LPDQILEVTSDINCLVVILGGTRWRSWSRHYATSRKVAGSIPDGVGGIFHCPNLSSRNVALGTSQPLTEMRSRNVSWGVKATGAYGRQPNRLHVPIVMKSGSLSLLEHSGSVQGLLYLYFFSDIRKQRRME
jgi:hypothetical protein